MEFEYSYVDGPEQYGAKPAPEVEARYVKETTEMELQGYPFWEALPVLEEFDPARFTVNLEDLGPTPDWDTDGRLKLNMLNRLDRIRVNLPFREMVEFYVRRALLVSYRDRAEFTVGRVPRSTGQPETEQSVVMTTPYGGLVSNGVAITGWSGCGKTTTIDELLMRFPKVIVHHLNGGVTRQVVWIKLDCLANRNLRGLLDSFGSQLDEALGLEDRLYERMVKKEHSIAGKAEEVIRLVKAFSIGLLVLDEVQMLDFSAEKESSYSSLMNIVNKTKMALVSVGTDEAVDKLYSYWHTSRRAGVNVPADEYCQDDSFLFPVVAKLFKYRFLDREIQLTAEMLNAYKDCTGGTVERLVSLHKEVVTDYILNGCTATVDADYIRGIAYRKWRNLEGIIRRKTRDRRILEARLGDSDSLTAGKEFKELERSFSKAIASIDDELPRWDAILQLVRTFLDVSGEMYSEMKIGEAMSEVTGMKTFQKIDDREAARKVIAHLKKKGSDKRHGPKPDPKQKEEFDRNGLTITGG